MLENIRKYLDDGNFIITLMYVLRIFLVGLVIIFTSALYVQQYNTETSKFELLEEQRTDILKNRVEEVSDLVISDLIIAKNHQEFFAYFDSNSNDSSLEVKESYKQNLIEELLVMARNRRVYDQIRFIDLDGDEVIKVRYRAGLTYAVANEDLQNTANLSYFTESINLAENDIYISPLNLYVENEQIEEPIKPMIRLATPVFHKGEKVGVLVFNYLAQEILSVLDENLGVSGEKVFLINNEGYWLKGPSQEDEWGFMYGDTSKTIYNWHSNLSKQTIDLTKRQVIYNSGLITIVTVKPFDDSGLVKNRMASNGESIPQILNDFNEEWKLITFLAKDDLHAEANNLLVYLVVSGILIIFLLVTSISILIYSLKSRVKAEDQINKLNDTLKIITKVLRHDLANAFTHINFSIELFGDSKEKKYLKEISTSAKHGISVIDKMKELEGMVNQGANLSDVSLKEVLNQVTANYKIDINIVGLKNELKVVADQGLNSVFENIISNAIRHAKVSKLDIKITTAEKKVIIKFIDQGKGIPDSVKDKVFDEGFKYGETANTGLGLYIVMQTIKRYGGTISVEDNKPKGTVFIIELKKSTSSKSL